MNSPEWAYLKFPEIDLGISINDRLERATKNYGSVRTRKLLGKLLSAESNTTYAN